MNARKGSIKSTSVASRDTNMAGGLRFSVSFMTTVASDYVMFHGDIVSVKLGKLLLR